LAKRVCRRQASLTLMWRAGLLGLACGGSTVTAHAQRPAAVLDRLVVMEDRVVGSLARPTLGWTGGQECLVAGGLDAAGNPQVLVYRARERGTSLSLSETSSLFAACPTGPQVAFWAPGPPGPDDTPTVRLALFDARTGATDVPEAIAPFLRAAPLAWLAEPERLLVARPREGRSEVVAVDPLTGTMEPLPVSTPGEIAALAAGPTPGEVVVGVPSAIGRMVFCSLDAATGIIGPPPEALARGGLAALQALSSDGSVRLEATGDALWIAAGEGQRRRLVPPADLGADAGTLGLTSPVWAPSGIRFAYVAATPGERLPAVHAAELGTETVTCVCRFPPLTQGLVPGTDLWVAMKFRFDEAGRVIEPEWPSLKAQLRITGEPRSSAAGVIVEAASVGTEPGFLERLTGSAQPELTKESESSISLVVGGTEAGTASVTYTAVPLPELGVWAKGIGLADKLLSIRIRREALRTAAPAGRE